MKGKIYFIFLLFVFSTLAATDDGIHPITSDLPYVPDDSALKVNQLTSLDHLIEATGRNLENQKQLRKLVENYLLIQETFLRNQEDQNQIVEMVRSAHLLFEKIKEMHLIQTFDPEFISELTFFSQIASKRSVPSPK